MSNPFNFLQTGYTTSQSTTSRTENPHQAQAASITYQDRVIVEDVNSDSSSSISISNEIGALDNYFGECYHEFIENIAETIEVPKIVQNIDFSNMVISNPAFV